MSWHEYEPPLTDTAYVVPPISITASAQSTSAIRVIWGYTTGGGHTGSRVKWGVVGGSTVGEFDVPINSLTYIISGLNPNTQYLIQVFGLKGSEVSPVSKDAQAKTHPAASVPASPTNLSATPTKNTMALTWSGPADASSYKISYGLAPSGAVIGSTTSVAAAHTVSGLSAGTNYYFDVRSSNNVGDSPPTRINKQTLPEAANVAPPITITASAQSTSAIRVIWGYTTGGGHTGSRVKWGVVGGSTVGEFDVPINSLTYIISGLNPNTQYLIQVFGLKGSEVSPVSKDAQAKTHPAASVPASPTNLSATPTKNTMALTWSGPADASSYKISYGLAPSGAVIGSTTSVAAAHTVSGLSAGTNYYFDVRSSNNVGDSPPTRITRQTLQVPGAPAGLRATATISTLEVQWSAVTGAVDYVIRYGVEPGGTVYPLTTRLLRETLANLNKNTLYFVEVSARNANGESSPSRITQRTLDGPPLPPKPGPLVVLDTFDTVRVSWATINQPGYEVAYGLLSQHPQVIARYETEHLTWLLRYLSPDVTYFIEVRAFNETGYSSPSYATVTIGPDRTQPRNLSNPGRTFNEARLTWDAPQDASYLIDYEVTCPGRPVVRTSTREHIATGLIPEREYRFTVQPRRPEGPVPALPAVINVVTHDLVPPIRVTALKLTPSTPGNALLSWSASQDNVAVTGYEVRRNSGSWIAVSGTSYPVSGLGSPDVFEVRAKDAAGNRSLSVTMTFTDGVAVATSS
ncbi:Chitinase A1 precursor [compost metagenome]